MTTFAWSDAQEMTDNAETCWGLIKGAAVGERVRQAEFARRYGPIVRAYLAARWNNTLLLANIDDRNPRSVCGMFAAEWIVAAR